MNAHHTQLYTSPYKRALLVDQWISGDVRRSIKNLLSILLVVFLVFRVAGVITVANHKIEGVFFVGLAVWLKLWLLDFFYNASIFGEFGKNTVQHNSHKGVPTVTLAVAELVEDQQADLVRSFLGSRSGAWVMRRCGIDQDAVTAFTERRTSALRLPEVAGKLFGHSNLHKTHTVGQSVTLKELVTVLCEMDQEFAQFITQAKSEKDDVIGAAEWLEWSDHEERTTMRWWSKESFALISSVVEDLQLGVGGAVPTLPLAASSTAPKTILDVSLVHFLEREIMTVEELAHVFFVYPAVRVLSEHVAQNEVLKARDLLLKIVTEAKYVGKHVVSKADVEAVLTLVPRVAGQNDKSVVQ